MNGFDNMASPMMQPGVAPAAPISSAPTPNVPVNNPEPNKDSSKLPLMLSFVLAFVVLVESIVLIFFGVNFFKAHDDDVPSNEPTSSNVEGSVKYDDDYTITALELKCSGDDFDITFDSSMNYTASSSQTNEAGTYYIINGEAVVLKNNAAQERTVYFDGFSIVDGTNFYACSGIE